MHPIVVLSHDNHGYVRDTLAQVARYGLHAVVVDTASTYRDTHTFLDQAAAHANVEVIRLSENLGSSAWTSPAVLSRLPRRFFLTDPDLAWNPRLPLDFPGILDELVDHYGAERVGFALDLSDAPQMFQDPDYFDGKSIASWEAKFWQSRLPHETLETYAAPIDTTFHLRALDRPSGAQVRIAGDFTARHLPWYRELVLSAHDLAHMYLPSVGSTIAKLVLREMARTKTLAAALAFCRQDCGAEVAAKLTAIGMERWHFSMEANA